MKLQSKLSQKKMLEDINLIEKLSVTSVYELSKYYEVEPEILRSVASNQLKGERDLKSIYDETKDMSLLMNSKDAWMKSNERKYIIIN